MTTEFRALQPSVGEVQRVRGKQKRQERLVGPQHWPFLPSRPQQQGGKSKSNIQKTRCDFVAHLSGDCVHYKTSQIGPSRHPSAVSDGHGTRWVESTPHAFQVPQTEPHTERHDSAGRSTGTSRKTGQGGPLSPKATALPWVPGESRSDKATKPPAPASNLSKARALKSCQVSVGTSRDEVKLVKRFAIGHVGTGGRG